MNGTKIIWIAGAGLTAFAVVLALSGNDSSTVQSAGSAPAMVASTDASRVVSNATSTPVAPMVSTTTGAAKPATPVAKVSAAADATAAAEKLPVVRAADAVDLGLDQTIHDAKVVAGNIVPKKDAKTGEMLLYADGKYEIRGLGTPESPYRVSWECLASASESYMPRLHENEIPQRIALLHGKVLEIDGYQAFPLMVSETKELIVMLNQWDGCCIGVPPTPYDAVEVKLLEPAKRGGRHAAFNFGGVRGTFRVDPYLVENWLVGLYILEGAQMVEGAKPEL
ncbi:MAG: hypothetical protein RI986_1193 [Planctomycetota bacterium]